MSYFIQICIIAKWELVKVVCMLCKEINTVSKSFLITIDTECDNQWDEEIRHGTENAQFIPRFQDICEKYGMKPTYLVDYEMANDDFLVDYLSGKAKRGLCEVGMHLHSWNTPPYDEIDGHNTKSYLIEHSIDIMEKKIASITELIEQRFGISPVSHRAGRWAIDENYIRLLAQYGYKVDCTFTPGVNWSKEIGDKIGGTNYIRDYKELLNIIDQYAMIEVPATIHKLRVFDRNVRGITPIAKEIVKYMIGKNIWIRPSLCKKNEIMKLLSAYSADDYFEFMMHSSEFMPGGSPYFPDEKAIEELFINLDEIFLNARALGFNGATLAEYACGGRE